MRRSKRFSVGRFNAGRFSGRSDTPAPDRYTISVTGVTDNATFGPTAQIGTQLRASATQFSDGRPDSVSWQWRNAQGDIPGAVRSRYRPVKGDNLAEIYPRATPSEIYAPQDGPVHLVRFAPPTVTEALPDVQFDTGSGAQTLDAKGAFNGSDLAYSVSTLVPGVLIDSETGLLNLSTTVEANGMISVTATNSGGSEMITFQLQISS